jgi:hypothetical protein
MARMAQAAMCAAAALATSAGDGKERKSSTGYFFSR